MKRPFPIVLTFALVFLFFIQTAGTLVESIYILDLMNTKLDEKVLGVLFFFAPLLLLPFYNRSPRWLPWIVFAIGSLSRGLLPYLKTADRVVAAGLGVFGMLSLFFLLLSARPKGGERLRTGVWGAAGSAMALGLSVLLRTFGYGLDPSLMHSGGWFGWILGLCLGWSLMQLDFDSKSVPVDKQPKGTTSAILGVYLILTLFWFSFSAPSVIARWTEGNYTLIVLLVSLFSVAWILISLLRPQWMDLVSPRLLLLWNLLFALSLTVTILVHRVPFPPTPDSAPVTVASPGLLTQIPLALMLLLFPVLFLDMRLFLGQLLQAFPTPRRLLPGILLGGLVIILLVFAHIFTNVWGYVQPVSLIFRNLFWLPYFVMAGLISLLARRATPRQVTDEPQSDGTFHWAWGLLLGAVFLGTAIRAFPVDRVQVEEANRTSIVVMTFNTQQSNDDFAERSFEEQLALIRRVSPDVLALQESDSTRISLNNNDYVRYFAEHLGYHSYYGPTTVAGTYGTAILSKYPLLNTRTVFTFSDKDEIGTAEAEIEVNGVRFTIYNVHPDGSDTAMLAFARSLLERSMDEEYVVALGDYNLRDHEEAYQLIDDVYVNAWVSVYPSEISPDGVDMSGDNRIDHIFLSPSLGVLNPVYVLPPESTTDHPVHWAEIFWDGQ